MLLLNGSASKNFMWKEIACRDSYKTININEPLLWHLERVQEFRDKYMRPMNVSSWYRTKEHNDSIPNASKNSRHIEGIATDFALPSEFYNLSTEEKTNFVHNVVKMWFDICGWSFGAFGIYDTFIHIDSRATDDMDPYFFDLRNNKNYSIVLPNKNSEYR